MRPYWVPLLGVALAVTSVTVSTAQLMRTEKIPAGKIKAFYNKGAVELTVEIPHSTGPAETANRAGDFDLADLAISVTDSLNELETGVVKLNSSQVAAVITNLQEMVNESAKTSDYLEYHLVEKKFLVSMEGGSKGQFGVSAAGATAGTYGHTEAENRQILKDFVELLKQGQARMLSGLEGNSEAAKGSPAAAAGLANVGRALTPQELADLAQEGQASTCAIVTVPPGAGVEIDGNKGGVTPLVFFLLKQGDTPRTITIRMDGYKTVEKKVVPDGKPITIGLTLEKQ